MVINQKPSVYNTVFYSTANSGYAIFAATSLLAIRKYLPDAHLCILSSGLSDYDRKIIEKNDIDYIELDLTKKFTKSWQYPVDCYYIFAGPEIFIDQGFEYSVYVDGDVLCASDPLGHLPNFKGIAGVASSMKDGAYTSVFGDDWEALRKLWNLPIEKSVQKRVNSGVVYFNNKRMVDIGLFEKAVEAYKVCLKNQVPRKGDDSLFSLLQYVYFSEDDITFLPARYNFVLQFNEWIYPIKDLVFFHFSIEKPWKSNSYQHKDSNLNVFNPYVKEWRTNLRNVAPKIWLSSTKYVAIDKIVSKIEVKRKHLTRLLRDQVMWTRGLKKSLFQRRANYHKAPIKLFWWRNIEHGYINFGDEITGTIIKKIFGYRSEYATIEECELIGAGSLLEMAERRKSDNIVKVWGSGYIEEKRTDSILDKIEFYAVRGKNSRDRVGEKNAGIALGDPGLLASLVYERAKYRTKKIGVVVHYADFDLPIVKKILHDPRFLLINPLDTPERVAQNISSCKFVFSSSLHGLIFADSFKIPNIHVKLSDNLKGGAYKFQDYYSSVGKGYVAADVNMLFDNEYINTLERDYVPVRRLSHIQRKLIASFPSDIR